MTRERLDPEMVALVPELAALVPPGRVHDKAVYSPWFDETFRSGLEAEEVDALVVTGGETDACVLATVLGAVDLGYRVVIATDALCSSSDETHDALLTLYRGRYGAQVETATVDAILAAWG